MSVRAAPRRSRRCEKDQFLFKEFASLDDAFCWARHVNGSGRVTLLIDGDDGTSLTKQEIAAALHNPDRADRGVSETIGTVEPSTRR